MYVAVDIGATWTRIAIADNTKIIEKTKYPTPKTKGEFLEKLAKTIRRLAKKHDAQIERIGIATIGPLNMVTGTITNPPNLPIRNIPLKKYLQNTLNTPTAIINDCTAAVIAEKHYGKGKNLENIVYITLSTGIGGGVIVDNNVLFGKHGNAGEIGHIVVDPTEKLKCGCGGYGHWEAYTGGKNIWRFIEHVIGKPPHWPNTRITYEILFTLYNQEDPHAKKILEEDISRINAIGVANVINSYDPELITLGGSITLNAPKNVIIEKMIELLPKYTTNAIPKIEQTELGEDIVLMGALTIARHPEIVPKKFR